MLSSLQNKNLNQAQMRVAINCRSFLNKNYTGIGRYTFQLIKSLIEIDRANEYLLYIPRKLFSSKRRIPPIRAKNFQLKIDLWERGLQKTVGEMDIYHSPSLGYLNGTKAKIVVTIHDLIFKTFPKGHTDATIETAEKQLEETVERASKIICCSQNTVDDLKKYYQVDPQKVALIYQGVNPQDFYLIDGDEEAEARQMLAQKGITAPYLLVVGTIEPRKNLSNILRAFSILKKKSKFKGLLVIAGMKGWMCEDLFHLIKELDLEKDVRFVGFVSNKELRFLYNRAEAFLFPSFYEGFGFPIVEAFSCGAPVVTSDRSSCPEIAEDAALKVDPHSPEAIARATEQILFDTEFRETLKQKGLRRAQTFSFARTARETLNVYQEIYRL